ncbi:MAG: glycoside hydrolase family 38 C-terminal domain-containing protein, partial [Bacteroidales bacterium]
GTASNGWQGEWVLKADGEASAGTIRLKGTLDQWDSVKLTIRTERSLLMNDYPIGRPTASTEIRPDLLVHLNPTKPSDNQWDIEGHLVASTIARDLDVIAASHLSRGTFHIMASSHQDIAWMDSPEACIEDRDHLLITPALEQLKENPDYANDMEDILMLREYLARHPDKKGEIHDLTLQGRLTWGASYIQPYEEMYMGEPLIRQFYLGRKWFRNEFPGCDARIYWNVDVPGRTLQMPQILAKSGVDYMIISRHDKGLFNWVAPDGSKVLTYSSDHYYNSYVHLKKGFFETVSHLADLTRFWDRYYSPGVASPVMPVLSDADMALPDSYFDYISTWESISASRIDSGWRLPRLIHSTAERFMDEAVATGVAVPEIRGERPAVWLYIHGPSHYEALKYGRSAGRTLPAAEKLATFRSLAENSWGSYPSELLTKAWESGIYPDHGWGGNQGTITDSTFQARFFEADSIARSIIRSSAEALAARVKRQPGTIPVTLFNTLSWERTDPVEVTVGFPDQGFQGIRLRDGGGQEVPFQVVGTPGRYPSGALKEVTILFVAEGVPANGYKSWHISKARTMPGAGRAAPGLPGQIETLHYRISLAAGGQSSLFDKELSREVWLADQFAGGELFTMRSFGNGAGEFADIQQPDMEGFDRLSAHQAGWVVREEGPLRVAITTEARFKHNKARVTWLVYKTIKRIDITVELIDWDGTAYREFRLAFPARLTNPEIAYEVPFGVVRVGRDELQHPAGERYTTPCPEVHPRGINNWISASDETMGITFSSPVAVWDYVNITTLPTAATLLQPVLLASRQSCHGLGPLYHQTGTHQMTFSLLTHAPGWQNGYQAALQANEPLVAVVDPPRNASDLPESWSFLRVDDPHTLISAIKKEDFGNGLVIRLYDMEGKDKQVTISPSFSFRQALLTDMLEENGRPVRTAGEVIPLLLGAYSIETILIKQ